MVARLVAVPVGAALLVTAAVPATSAKMTRQQVADAFILAMKSNDVSTASTYVSAVGPGGKKAVLERQDYVYKGKSSWDTVTGADCSGYICSAAGFPATPEPAWYVLKRKGAFRVVGQAYRESADYLLYSGEYGCLTKDRKVRNRATDWNFIKRVPKGTPVWWATGAGGTNVAVDAGEAAPRTKMIFGYIKGVQKDVSRDCGD
jgi:hypothetical protein